MMKKALSILSTLIILAGCAKVFLGDEEPNSPVNNFELFWHDFDQHYGLFVARGWSWDSIYETYHPQIDAETSSEELWAMFKDMISYLDDSHTFVYAPSEALFFASGSELDSIVETEFDIDLVQHNYLETVHNIPNSYAEEDDTYLYGKLKDKDIGYIYLSGVEVDDNDFMDEVLKQIGDHKAIVLDLRNNLGGDDVTAEAIAGRFADGEHLIYTVQERDGPKHNDFAPKKEYWTKRKGKQHFSKPLVVLTDRITVSAAEVLLLHLNSFSQVTQIGDTTAGDFSDTGMRRFLPNGWQYQYSIMMFLLPDGTSLDGIGHIPDVQIRNSSLNIQSHNDLVLEKAISYLWQTYGIE